MKRGLREGVTIGKRDLRGCGRLGSRGYAGVRVAERRVCASVDDWEAGLREVADEFARSLRRGASLRFSLVVAASTVGCVPKAEIRPVFVSSSTSWHARQSFSLVEVFADLSR